MFDYRIFPTNVRPLPLDVTSEEFAEEWQHCMENEDRSLKVIMKMLRPAILHWVQLIENPEYKRDINYISLYMSLINQVGRNKYDRLKLWKKYIEEFASIEEEITFIWIRTLRKMRFFPTSAKPIMAEYAIARRFIQYLMDSIRKGGRPRFETLSEVLPEIELTYEDKIPDLITPSKPIFTPWQHYLISLIAQGYTPNEMGSLFHIPRETFYYEEKKIWHALKERSSTTAALAVSKES